MAFAGSATGKSFSIPFMACLLFFTAFCFACDADNSGDDPSTGSGQADDDDDQAGADDDDDDDDNDDNDNDDDDDDDDDDNDDQPTGPQLIFDLTPDEKNTPFPSVIFLNDDNAASTGYRVDVTGQVTSYLDEIIDAAYFIFKGMNELEGFSVVAPVWFPVGNPPNQAQFPDHLGASTGDSVFCVVLADESHPHHGEFQALDVDFVRGWQLIQAYPHRPFFENTTYACVVSAGLRTAAGEPYVASDHFRYIMSEQPDPTQEDYEFLEPVRQKFAPYFDELFAQYDLAPEDILSATFFHTQWTTHDLSSIRQQAEDLAIANPPQVGVWERIDLVQENVDAVWEATFAAPSWLHDGKFAYDANGDPVPSADSQIILRLTIPSPGEIDYQQPFPVVMFGHGINGDRFQARHLAEQFAGRGIATAAIDWIYHGARAQYPPGLPDWLIGAVQTMQFINVFTPKKMRDNFQQGAADMIWLKHVIRGLAELDLAPYETGGDSLPDLDTEHVFFAGMSLGSMQGGILAAVEPDLDGYLLNTGAVDFRSVAIEGEIGDILIAVFWLLDLFVPGPLQDNIYLAFELFRNMVDAGDPYSYARYVLDEPVIGNGPRTNILHQMAAYDETLGGPASAKMAWSMNLTQLTPYVFPIDEMTVADPPFSGPGSFQYDTGYHNFLVSHNDFFDAAHLQAGTFLRTAYDTGVGTIINPFEK